MVDGTLKEAALKADSGRKMISCRTGDSNPRQYCAWLFSRILYPLSYRRPSMCLYVVGKPYVPHAFSEPPLPSPLLHSPSPPPPPPPPPPSIFGEIIIMIMYSFICCLQMATHSPFESKQKKIKTVRKQNLIKKKKRKKKEIHIHKRLKRALILIRVFRRSKSSAVFQ